MLSHMMGNLDAIGGISKPPMKVGDSCDVRRVIRDEDGVVSTRWVTGTVRHIATNESGIVTSVRCDLTDRPGYSAWYEPQNVRAV